MKIISLIFPLILVTAFGSNYGAAAAAQPQERGGITIARSRLPKLWVDYLVQRRQVDGALQKRLDVLFESEPIKGLFKQYEDTVTEWLPICARGDDITDQEYKRRCELSNAVNDLQKKLEGQGFCFNGMYIFGHHKELPGYILKIAAHPVEYTGYTHRGKPGLQRAPDHERLPSRVLLADTYNAIARKCNFQVLSVVDKRVYFANSADNRWLSMIVVEKAVSKDDVHSVERCNRFEKEFKRLIAAFSPKDWYTMDGDDIGYSRNARLGVIYDTENWGLSQERLTDIFTRYVLEDGPIHDYSTWSCTPAVKKGFLAAGVVVSVLSAYFMRNCVGFGL